MKKFLSYRLAYDNGVYRFYKIITCTLCKNDIEYIKKSRIGNKHILCKKFVLIKPDSCFAHRCNTCNFFNFREKWFNLFIPVMRKHPGIVSFISIWPVFTGSQTVNTIGLGMKPVEAKLIFNPDGNYQNA